MASEHVEMEQVPLKSDTDKPATEGAQDESKADGQSATPFYSRSIITPHITIYRDGDENKDRTRDHDEISASVQSWQER
jgi:hypothetical protein